MSKKIAAGAEGIVLDVKVGNGAFMKSLPDARMLAETMQELGRGAGRQVVALLTDMDQPLGWAIGNAIEIEEVRAMLAGEETPPDLFSLAIQATGQLLALSDLGIDADEGVKRAEKAVDDGSAAEMFERWIAAQGGDLSAGLPKAAVTRELTADREGFVGEVTALGLGRAALELGAGRRTKEDVIDHAVGIRCFAKRGDVIEAGQTLAAVYAQDEAGADHAIGQIRDLIAIVDEPQPPRPIVLETLA
jgi:pyrimidine-nucleoside phosphorylase